MSVSEKKEITVAEARKLLMDKAEELDPLQRRVLEYTIRFSKLDSESAKELTEQLIKEAEIDRGLAVQIANAMPVTVPEIRTFLGRQRIIAEDTLNKILDIIDKYRVNE
jgi:DNA-directed RNA polymerase subunit F